MSTCRTRTLWKFSTKLLPVARDRAVVLLAREGTETVVEQGMKFGALDCLVKTHLTPSALNRAVQRAIEKAALMRTIAEQRNALQQLNGNNTNCHKPQAATHLLEQGHFSVSDLNGTLPAEEAAAVPARQ